MMMEMVLKLLLIFLQATSSGNLVGGARASSTASDPSIRQQQFIIVQTTGSNGLPTNLAVPASIVISPQGQLILNDQSSKGPPRASSAPPVQSGNQIIINTQQQQQNPNSYDSSNINVSSSNGATVSDSLSKGMSIPTLEIQEGGGVRVMHP
jgi:hypothetical protein